jgi:hypothetical protein
VTELIICDIKFPFPSPSLESWVDVFDRLLGEPLDWAKELLDKAHNMNTKNKILLVNFIL